MFSSDANIVRHVTKCEEIQKETMEKTQNNKNPFLTFLECFEIPIIFSNLNYNCSNLSDMRNLQEQVKMVFCYCEKKLF